MVQKDRISWLGGAGDTLRVKISENLSSSVVFAVSVDAMAWGATRVRTIAELLFVHSVGSIRPMEVTFYPLLVYF